MTKSSYIFLIFYLFLFGFLYGNDENNNFILDNRTTRQSIYDEPLKIFWFYNLSNVEHLRNTSDVESLIISYSANSNASLDLSFINEIPQLSQLKKLHIGSGQNVENTESLKRLTNLEELTISGLELTNIDITPIAELKSLKILNLFDLYHIYDISVMSFLQNLERLSINNCNNIKSLDPIFEITGLKWLQIVSNAEYDLTNIDKLRELELLNIRINNQENINNISRLYNLTRLIIQFDVIDDVSPLLNLVNLEELIFLGENVNILPLSTISTLKYIVVMFSTREKYLEFILNEGNIFERNGISIYTGVPH